MGFGYYRCFKIILVLLLDEGLSFRVHFLVCRVVLLVFMEHDSVFIDHYSLRLPRLAVSGFLLLNLVAVLFGIQNIGANVIAELIVFFVHSRLAGENIN